MQYGLSEKFDGIVRMVLVVAAVVRDVLEKSIAISNLMGADGYRVVGSFPIFAHQGNLEYNSKWSEKPTDWSRME